MKKSHARDVSLSIWMLRVCRGKGIHSRAKLLEKLKTTHKKAMPIINNLMRKGYLRVILMSDGRPHRPQYWHYTTKAGEDFLHRYDDLWQVLKTLVTDRDLKGQA